MSASEACCFSHWCWFIYPIWPLVPSFHVCSHFCSVHVTQTSQVIFFTADAHGWNIRHSAGTTVAPIVLKLQCFCVAPSWLCHIYQASSTARLPRNGLCRLRPPHPQSPKEVEWQGRTGQTEIEKEKVEIDWKETRMTGGIKDDTETSCHYISG